MGRFFIDLLGLEQGKAYGFQEYVFNLLNYFYQHRVDIRYEQIIIWCKDSSRDMFLPYEKRFEIKSFTYSSYFKKHWIQTLLPIKEKLSKEDLLFSPGNVSGFVKRGTEILTIHDLLFKRRAWLPSKLMRWQREIMIPISIRKADRIVAISQFTKEDVEKYYPAAKGKIVVIYNSFNFEKYECDENTDIGESYFIAISTTADYKNQRSILNAFKLYVEKGGDKMLVIIGRMIDDSEVCKVYSSLPQHIREKIIWRSNLSNAQLGAMYKGASCFISASKFEGLGMPVVEAMSFGLPVLLSDIPPHREVSINKGEYFEPTDVEKLAEKMININFEKRDYSVDIKRLFSEKNTSAKYVELINILYAKSRSC